MCTLSERGVIIPQIYTFLRVKKETREILRFIQKEETVDKTLEKLIRFYSCGVYNE